MVNNFKHSYKFFVKLGAIFTLMLLKKSAKIGFIFGSKYSYFNYFHTVCPLFGLLGIASVAAQTAISYTSFTNASLLLLHIPTIGASLYWAQRNQIMMRYVVRMLSVLGIVLFVAHPVGLQAALYASFWLVPFGLSFISRPSIVVSAFISTFIAHEVGSLLWLYYGELSATEWLSLLPVVPVERTCMALLMVVSYYAGIRLYSFIEKFLTQFIFVEARKKGLLHD